MDSLHEISLTSSYKNRLVLGQLTNSQVPEGLDYTVAKQTQVITMWSLTGEANKFDESAA